MNIGRILDQNHNLKGFHYRVNHDTQSKLCKFMGNYLQDRIPPNYNPEEHDPIICNLIKTIINQKDGSLEQRKTVNKLLLYFYTYPKLPNLYVQHNLKSEDYDDAYNRATSILAGINLNKDGLTEKSSKFVNGRKIREFVKKNDFSDLKEPEIIRQRFVGFFKTILDKRIRDFYRHNNTNKENNLSLDNSKDDNAGTYLDNIADPTISGLDTLINEEDLKKNKAIDNKLKQELENFGRQASNIYPEGYPQCHCYELIQRRELKIPKERWANIAKEFKIPYGTVTAHYQRKCKKLIKDLAKSKKVEE